MPVTPEQQARVAIDALMTAAGWSVQDYRAANLTAARRVVLREFEFTAGHGTADYLLYVAVNSGSGLIEKAMRV
jgi:type I restriction enzyme, R subunit